MIHILEAAAQNQVKLRDEGNRSVMGVLRQASSDLLRRDVRSQIASGLCCSGRAP
jgi:hypothetical protein